MAQVGFKTTKQDVQDTLAWIQTKMAAVAAGSSLPVDTRKLENLVYIKITFFYQD